MKINIYLIFLILLFFSIDCNKEQENLKPEKLVVRNINLISCSNSSKKSSSNPFCIAIQAINGNYLKIQNYHAEFCCASEDSAGIELEFRNDTIIIKEIDLGPYTWCFCRHDLEFEIGPLKDHNYTLQLIESVHSYKRDTSLLNFSFINTLNVTNCK